MDLRERALYHQIHPVKLATDAVSAVWSLFLLAQHRLGLALAIMLVPPVLVSGYLIAFGTLDDLRTSRFGAYMRRHMTGGAQLLRLLGMLAMAVGAWCHTWALVASGAGAIAWAWTRGLFRT